MVDFAMEAHAIIDSDELLAIGIDKRSAWRRVQRGRLFRLHVGVYSVVPPQLLRPRGRWLAGVKAAKPDAVLSFGCAAALWELRAPPSGRVHVSVPGSSGRRSRPGLCVHRCSSLTSGDLTVRDGISVTTPSRTLRDVKRTASTARFEAMLAQAAHQQYDLGAFAFEEPNRNEIERRFLTLCRRHGLPSPVTQRIIGPYTVDFFWPGARLVVETDGFETHGTRGNFESDRARDAWLATQGYRVVRFTWRQLRDEPETVIRTLRRLLGE
jgi:very-short-patch-repair endonuclease